MELQGTTVVVTGSAGGIGCALVQAFGGAGAGRVVGVDRPGSGADVELDVTEPGAVAAALDGMDRVDVAVANAGIGIAGLVEDLPMEAWRETIAVNLSGVVETVVPAYQRMRAQGSGTLVLMASLSGLVGTPLLVPYATTKAAVVGLGASLRPEAARHGVGVVVVCPGPVETPLLDAETMTPGTSVRRHLIAGAGPPMAPARLAGLVVDAVRRDRPLVVPGRALALSVAARHVPRLTQRVLAVGLRRELRAAGVA